MRRIPAGEFKARCLRIMEEVKKYRAPVLITKKGRPVAKLVPPDEPVADVFGCMVGTAEIVGDVEARTRRIDQHLTDIMLAQDFHDLTGQVVAKVVTLATDLEDSLLKLLVQVVPPEQRDKVVDVPQGLQGPVVDAAARTDVVKDQTEVDDLLASLGF